MAILPMQQKQVLAGMISILTCKLKPGTDYKKFEAKFPAFCDKYMNNQEWEKTNNSAYRNSCYSV